ncbi:MAG: RNA polymerase sigma factor [Bryobacteraceae bacterium]
MSAAAIDPFVLQQAEIRASRMVGSYGFTREDWEDLRQELLLDYMKRQPRFDPARGDQRGFVFGVLRNHAAKLATAGNRARAASKLPDAPPDPCACVTARLEAELHLRIDVQAVLSRLPEHLRILAIQLTEMSAAEVCRESGRSRSCIYRWIAELRRAFRSAGLTPAVLGGRGGAR